MLILPRPLTIYLPAIRVTQKIIPHPLAHSAPNFIKFAPTHPTQALFHTGLIPGETDFRIYRDFGDIPGTDFAVLTNGWVYHTWRDDMDHLDFRSVQRYGAAWHSRVEMLGR